MRSRLKTLWATLRRRYQTLPRVFQLVVMSVIAFGAVMLVYAPVVRFNTYRVDVQKEIESYREEVSHLQAYVGRAEQVDREGNMLGKRLDGLKTRLVPGNTGTLAAARLQDRVTTLAASTAVSVQSAQVMREERVGRYVQVTVRLTVRATLKALAEYLEGIEYGETQLSVPFLQIDRRGAVARRTRGVNTPAEDDRILSATLEVRGLAAVGEAETPPDAAAEEETPA